MGVDYRLIRRTGGSAPHLEIGIPENKRIASVDITKTPREAVYEVLPVSPLDQMRADLDYLAMMGGIELWHLIR